MRKDLELESPYYYQTKDYDKAEADKPDAKTNPTLLSFHPGILLQSCLNWKGPCLKPDSSKTLTKRVHILTFHL
jgi:hypothetical protein